MTVYIVDYDQCPLGFQPDCPLEEFIAEADRQHKKCGSINAMSLKEFEKAFNADSNVPSSATHFIRIA